MKCKEIFTRKSQYHFNFSPVLFYLITDNVSFDSIDGQMQDDREYFTDLPFPNFHMQELVLMRMAPAMFCRR